MELYVRTRSNPSTRIDKGIKSKVLVAIATEMQARGMQVDKGIWSISIVLLWADLMANGNDKKYADQCKSKYSKIMSEYDIYRKLCNLSGAGWDCADVKPTFDDDGWRALCEGAPRNASLYKRIKERGFPHNAV